MIDDDEPWKRDLERAAANLLRRRTQRRWSEASWSKAERLLLNGAFAVRKLIDSEKLSDEVDSISMRAAKYASTGVLPDWHNRHDLDKLYDLSASVPIDVSLTAFCNQLIHSYILVPMCNETDGLEVNRPGFPGGSKR